LKYRGVNTNRHADIDAGMDTCSDMGSGMRSAPRPATIPIMVAEPVVQEPWARLRHQQWKAALPLEVMKLRDRTEQKDGASAEYQLDLIGDNSKENALPTNLDDDGRQEHDSSDAAELLASTARHRVSAETIQLHLATAAACEQSEQIKQERRGTIEKVLARVHRDHGAV